MFTGIVASTGIVRAIEPRDESVELVVDAGNLVRDCQSGDSIAINGVCLTATEVHGTVFRAVAVAETLRRTTLGKLRSGGRVNLELSLRADGRLGGHFVQGHVDGIACVTDLQPEGESVLATFQIAPELGRYIVEKGSIAVDGVSLTVVGETHDGFSVALIPHTRAVTTLGDLQMGCEVNVEVDLLAKYVERLTADIRDRHV